MWPSYNIIMARIVAIKSDIIIIIQTATNFLKTSICMQYTPYDVY